MFEAIKHHKENPWCYHINMIKERSKKLNEKKLVWKEFQVGNKVLLYKSGWKQLLGKQQSRSVGSFIVN